MERKPAMTPMPRASNKNIEMRHGAEPSLRAGINTKRCRPIGSKRGR